MDTTSFMQIIS